jgi:hypothetical protein
VLEVKEAVINIVSYEMVEKVSLASCDFAKGVNEFVKAGFTEVRSLLVKPPRVAESPASFECKVNQVISLGAEGGAGNLVICEVLLIHMKDKLLDESGKIDPQKLDAVARMGGENYCRAFGDAIFKVPKPNEKVGIGYDQIPINIRNSKVLTGNDLGRLGNIEKLPDAESVKIFMLTEDWSTIYSSGEAEIHRYAQQLLRQGKLEDAWKALLGIDARTDDNSGITG